MIARDGMARGTRLAASLLFGVGLLLVFTGLSAAFGFAPLGMLASALAIAGLLSAGGVWFGARPPRDGSSSHGAQAPRGRGPAGG